MCSTIPPTPRETLPQDSSLSLPLFRSLSACVFVCVCSCVCVCVCDSRYMRVIEKKYSTRGKLRHPRSPFFPRHAKCVQFDYEAFFHSAERGRARWHPQRSMGGAPPPVPNPDSLDIPGRVITGTPAQPNEFFFPAPYVHFSFTRPPGPWSKASNCRAAAA